MQDVRGTCAYIVSSKPTSPAYPPRLLLPLLLPMLLLPLLLPLLLQALSSLDKSTFQKQLGRFFPVLTKLMVCDYATADVQRALSELFLVRVGPMLPSGQQ